MQQVRQQLHVALRAQDVVAGFRVARFGEVRERADADALRQVVLGHAVRDFGFERGVLVLRVLLVDDVEDFKKIEDFERVLFQSSIPSEFVEAFEGQQQQ